ncbi:MAG TPA: hypothetical protein PKI94_01485 [Candidatus Gastranaerophilaceae bacterium]|nr:hypothetical protein [Candidatus Gastranaerophilaceae bacterium]
MVNSVSFGNSYGNFQPQGYVSPYYLKKAEDTAKYTTAAVNAQSNEGGPFTGVGLWSGFMGAGWLWRNRKDIRGGFNTLKVNGQTQAELFKADGGLWSRNAYKQAFLRYETEAAKAAKLSSVDQSIKNLNKLSAQAKKAGVTFEEYVAKNAGKTGMLSKAGDFIKNTKAVKAAGKIPGLSKIAKLGKGNGFFFAISAALELFTQVIPTFKQLGAKAGWKQIGKSTATTIGTVGGFVAGQAAGAAAGAAIGAAVGSVIPVAGTAVGAVVGLACGFLGSWLGGKAAKAVVGENELDKAKKEGRLPADDAQPEVAAQTQLPGQNESVGQIAQLPPIPGLENPLMENNSMPPFTAMPQPQAQQQPQQQVTAFGVNNPFAARRQKQFQPNSNPFGAGIQNQMSSLPYAERDFMSMTAGLA